MGFTDHFFVEVTVEELDATYSSKLCKMRLSRYICCFMMQCGGIGSLYFYDKFIPT